MNTSLFVGLCENAGLEVDFRRELAYVYAPDNALVATVDEAARALFWIDTYGMDEEQAIKTIEIVTSYALTPVEERE